MSVYEVQTVFLGLIVDRFYYLCFADEETEAWAGAG